MMARFVILILVMCWPTSLWGDDVCYQNQFGKMVSFVDISEVSPEEAAPLFGAPRNQGDSLLFPATGFISQASDQAIDLVAGRLMMTITAEDGYLLDSITVSEFGSFLTFGDTAEAMVSASGFVFIGDQVYDGRLSFDTEGQGQGNWFGEFTISFPSTESISFVLDSSLLTYAGEDEAAFIDNVGIRISAGSFVAIPEPSGTAISLLALATGIGLASHRRR